MRAAVAVGFKLATSSVAAVVAMAVMAAAQTPPSTPPAKPVMQAQPAPAPKSPIAQAEEYYRALRKRGVEVVFVRYPREGHGIQEPNHRIDLFGRQLEWFDSHLGIKRPKTEKTSTSSIVGKNGGR